MANHAVDFTGQRFGKITAIHVVRKPEIPEKLFWLCRCDCGNETVVSVANLITNTKSCGCSRLDHGLARRGQRHFLYARWKGMRARCRNPKDARYKYYGARGIAVCKRWDSFANFLEDMLPTFVAGLTIERKDNNGPYSPENCIWANSDVQQSNKRSNRYITFAGKTLTVSEWAKKIGCLPGRLIQRLNAGKSVAQVMCNKKLPRTRLIIADMPFK